MYTYEEILTRLERRYETLCGRVPDEASDIGIRLRVLSGELFALYARLDYLRKQILPSSADGEYLDCHAQMRGLDRKESVKARGNVTFYLASASANSVRIPAGTVVATDGSNAARYRTLAEVLVPAGSLSVSAAVEALNGGADGNVGAGRVCVLVTPCAGIDHVENVGDMFGGSDEENDEQLRTRLLNNYKNISNGTNKAYYIEQAMSVDGVWSVGILPRARGAGTVDVYIAGQDGTADNALIAAVQAKLERAREINVDVHVGALIIIPCDVNIIVKIRGGYDFDDVSADITSSVRNYFYSLQGGETVYLSEIGKCISGVDGVVNYTFVKSLSDDMIIAPNCAARLGNINITQRD